jgi:hypothetical protein
MNMSYAIFKNGKRTVRQVFADYEKARQHVRKMIRKSVDQEDYNYVNGNKGFWDNISRNPSAYGILGYEIRKVATKRILLPVAMY